MFRYLSCNIAQQSVSLQCQVTAGDQVQFVPQTVEQAYLARKETNEKVALLRQRAQGLLPDDAAVLEAFQVPP